MLKGTLIALTDFEEALEDAKKYVGEDARILALPLTFKTVSVGICMKE